MYLLEDKLLTQRPADDVGLVVPIRQGYHRTRARIDDFGATSHFVPMTDELEWDGIVLKFSISKL